MDGLMLRRRLIAPKLNVASGQLPLSFAARRMSLKSLTRYGKCEQRRLPQGYTQLKYIQSDGGQLIDLGLKWTYGISTKTVCEMLESETTALGCVGSRNSNTIVWGNYTNQNGINYTCYGDVVNIQFTQNMVDGSFHTWETKPDGFYLDGVQKTNLSGSNQTLVSNDNICLFGRYDGAGNIQRRGKWRISSHQTFVSGTLLQDLVAAKRDSDNEVGMYDRISGQFFTNVGSGTFTAGPDATPTPSAPMDIWCNNGRLKVRHQSGLPLGFTQLEYIESTGTQYIDAGVSGPVRWVGEAECTQVLSKSQCLLGALYYPSGASTPTASVYLGSQVGSSKYWQLCGEATSPTIQTVSRVAFDVTFGDNSCSGTLNGRTISRAHSYSNFTTWSIGTAFGSQGNYPFSGYIYPLKAYQNDVLVRDFVPAKRNSDNVVGLYDKVSDTFLTNAGTGDFIAGSEASDPFVVYTDDTPEVLTKGNLPLGYTLLDYVQTSGQAYIDTGVKTSLDTEIGAELAFDSASTQIVWANHENNTAAITCFITTSGNERFGNKAISGINTLQYITAGTFHNLKENKDGIYIDGTKRVQFDAMDEFESPNSMYLLWCRNTSQQAFSGKVKGAFVKKGGMLVRNYVPAKRDADNAVGLYDTVTDTFFENQGSGSFTAGSEVFATCSVADLLAVGDYEDEHDLISGLVTRKCGVCVYDGTQTIGDVYLSTTGGKDVGAIIVYPLATPATESTTPQPLNSAAGTNTVATVANVSNPSATIKYYK